MPIISNKFECKICDFTCSKLSNWKIHESTTKHLSNVQGYIDYNTEKNNLNKKIFTCDCGNIYKHHSGLWRHQKQCNYNHYIASSTTGATSSISSTTSSTRPINNVNPEIDVNMILNLMQQNQDFKQLLLLQYQEAQKQHKESQKQQQEFMKLQQDSQKQMFEIMKDNIGTTNNNNTMINSNNTNNNKFNLNVFLNETCKDAMNLSDFIDSIKVKFEDIEYTGENGFAAGVSRIFLQELNKLEICKRPIHCSDVKREIFHIKDQDSWEKERKLLVKVIQQITRKNIVLLVDWRLAHPGCMEYKNIMNNKYDKINGECLGPYKDDEELRDYNRIISNVAKATMIDKKPLL